VIAFDFQEALSFEGDTGPYVQYAVVRARSISRKLEEKGERVPDFRAELNAGAFGRQLQSEDFWQVLLAASKADAALERAVAQASRRTLPSTRFRSRRRSTISIISTPSFTSRTARKKVSCCG